MASSLTTSRRCLCRVLCYVLSVEGKKLQETAKNKSMKPGRKRTRSISRQR